MFDQFPETPEPLPSPREQQTPKQIYLALNICVCSSIQEYFSNVSETTKSSLPQGCYSSLQVVISCEKCL